jgi:hypothetical protein
MLVAFGALVHHLHRMLFGEPNSDVPAGERIGAPIVILALPLIALAWLGVALPSPLSQLLTRAAEVLHP